MLNTEQVKVTDTTPGAVTVALSGTIDAAISDAFYSEVEGVFGRSGRDIVLNCAALEFIDSTTLGVMVKLHKRITAAGHRLIISNLIPRIRKLFEICALDKLMELE